MVKLNWNVPPTWVADMFLWRIILPFHSRISFSSCYTLECTCGADRSASGTWWEAVHSIDNCDKKQEEKTKSITQFLDHTCNTYVITAKGYNLLQRERGIYLSSWHWTKTISWFSSLQLLPYIWLQKDWMKVWGFSFLSGAAVFWNKFYSLNVMVVLTF